MTTQKNGWKVITISLYDEDLERIDACVAGLKDRGWTGANRSHLIRLLVGNLSETSLDNIAAHVKGRR